MKSAHFTAAPVVVVGGSPMSSDTLPRVLRHPHGAISMERALKQIRRILSFAVPDTDRAATELDASIEVVEVMLKAVSRDDIA